MVLPGLYTSKGALERPIHVAGWFVPPRIWLEGDSLCWSVGRKGYRECRRAIPTMGLLERFVRLADSSPDRILAFSQQNGLLGLKKPRDRPKAESWIVLNKRHRLDYGYKVLEAPVYGPDEHGGEPVKNWRFWAQKFSAALAIASSLSQGQYGDKSFWQIIFGESYGPPPKGYKSPLEGVTDEDTFIEIRGEFYMEITGWLTLGDVSLNLDYEGNGLLFATDTLFSGLALQLASAVCGSGGFTICSCCSKPYSPARQPASNTRHYCRECGRRAAVRDAVRASRARQRSASPANKAHTARLKS